jgi:hypothetical protein
VALNRFLSAVSVPATLIRGPKEFREIRADLPKPKS